MHPSFRFAQVRMLFRYASVYRQAWSKAMHNRGHLCFLFIPSGPLLPAFSSKRSFISLYPHNHSPFFNQNSSFFPKGVVFYKSL